MSKWGGRPAARFRALILARDGYRCRMVRDGRPCGDPATTVQHVVPLSAGGPRYDPANAVAACAPCNQGEGGRLGKRPSPAPATLTAEQARVVGVLDTLGVPHDAGQTRAARALLDAGYRSRRADIHAAARWRRARGPAHAPPSRPW